MLTEEEKQKLHEIARTTLEDHIRHGKIKDFAIDAPSLLEPRGAFVTLKKKGQLRGCIGYIEPRKPLWESIRDMTVASSTQDSRFPPVQPDELNDIQIQISALTPLTKIENLEEIEVGKHGILLRKGFYSGLLLPQVATEYNWDRDEFLKHTCAKADIAPEELEDAEIFIFSAEVF